ncbi:MAG: hypothetical protein WCL18_07650 [bacterium]
MATSQISEKNDDSNIKFHSAQQNIKNKKIYFDSNGTEIKIGYDDETGIGFVELISE